jgi:uncharacterized repeat protein (TIGR02543 family)
MQEDANLLFSALAVISVFILIIFILITVIITGRIVRPIKELADSADRIVDGKYEFVEDNSGDFKLIKVTVGSYEKGVERLVSLGGFTIECLHSIGFGSIYSSYASTVSKFEHMKRFGVWAGSYNELIQYLREAQNVTVNTVEKTETSIKISVTDTLDNFMYDQALTIKVDIPDSWKMVTVMQGDKEIPFVALDVYKASANMSTISCTIEDGFLYVDAVPDCGDVVITLAEKDDSANDYKDRVTVTFEPNEGLLKSSEYEVKVLIGDALASMPTPEKLGNVFRGWYTDAECTQRADKKMTFTENTTLYALWEQLPLCKDGTYNHKWTNEWAPSTDGVSEVCGCKNCDATLSREIEKAEDAE